MTDFYAVKIGSFNKTSTNLESAIRNWNLIGMDLGLRPGDKIELKRYRDGVMITHANIIHVLGINQVYLNPNITLK